MIRAWRYYGVPKDKGQHTGLILIDLQKAFDTINYEILLEKMAFLNFSETAIAWFRSYLTNRSFIVDVDSTLSEPAQLVCGVPQGSIIGPLLFLVYINDLPQAVKDSDIRLYVDDTCISFKHKNIVTINENSIKIVILYGIGFLTTNYQFTLERIRPKLSFLVPKI